MEAFLVSAGVVALAELGDKTQLLALVLAARFRAPLPVIAGIVTAVLANHLLAGAVELVVAEQGDARDADPRQRDHDQREDGGDQLDAQRYPAGQLLGGLPAAG